MTNSLDPFLTKQDIEVEPEELLEPDLEVAEDKAADHKGLRYRLNHYGNRVLNSGSKFLRAADEAIRNIGTALAGSIILLPLVIVARAVPVLSHGLLDLIKPLILSTIRLCFETLHAIIAPVRTAFVNFNKYVLFPLLKRIREDDLTALIAFAVLLVVIGGIVYLLSVVF